VTTHPRARVFQAGAFVALIGGLITVAPAPAQAADPGITITGLTQGNLKSGDRSTLRYRITNPPGDGQKSSVDVKVTVSFPEVTCTDKCDFTDTIAPGGSTDYSAELTAGTINPGDIKSGQIQITATISGSGQAAQSRPITARGDDKPQGVTEVSGKVRDESNKAVGNAEVGLKDSAGHEYRVTTNSTGKYRFGGSDAQPITVGSITVAAQKEGFTNNAVVVVGVAGKAAAAPAIVL
jgi:hypothetical protein